ITDMWPPGQYVTASVAWFKCGCYDEPEENWRKRINGARNGNQNSASEQRVERSAGNFATALTRIVASGDIPGGSSDQRLPMGNAPPGNRAVAAPVIVIPARDRQ